MSEKKIDIMGTLNKSKQFPQKYFELQVVLF